MQHREKITWYGFCGLFRKKTGSCTHYSKSHWYECWFRWKKVLCLLDTDHIAQQFASTETPSSWHTKKHDNSSSIILLKVGENVYFPSNIQKKRHQPWVTIATSFFSVANKNPPFRRVNSALDELHGANRAKEKDGRDLKVVKPVILRSFFQRLADKKRDWHD